MTTYTGKMLDQYKSDYESAQQEYNNMLQGSGGRLVSPSSLEHAKNKMDLAATDYGQAHRAQSTNSTPSKTFGTIETPLLNEYLAKQQTQSSQGQTNNGFRTFGTIETPVLNEFLASHQSHTNQGQATSSYVRDNDVRKYYAAKTAVSSAPLKTMPLEPLTPTLTPKSGLLPALSIGDMINSQQAVDTQKKSPYQASDNNPSTLERIGRTVLGAGENVIGALGNAADMVSKIPITAPGQSRFLNELIFGNDDSYELAKAGYDKLIDYGKQNTEKAKQGLTGIGKTAIDVGSGGLQLAADIGIGALTGGSSLIPMAAQAFGSGGYEAEQSGASFGKQLAYGGLQAGTVALTQGLGSVGKVLTGAFGEGVINNFLTNATDKAITKYVTSEAGKAVASRLAATGETALSQGAIGALQTALTPVYQRIVYDPNARLNATDILHSAIVSAVMGGALGALGGAKETEQAKTSQEVSKFPIREELINPANYEKKVETSLEQSNMTKFADNVNSSMEPPQSSASDNNANSTEFLQQQFAEFLKARKVDELKKAYSENEKSNRIDQNKGTGYNENAGEIPIKPYSTSRPKYGNTQVGDVWNNYKDPMTGKAPDPAGGSISWDKTKPRQGQWDMGHIPGEKYSDMRCRYIRGEISQKEFLEWYRNPANYRPELPSTNRSHKYE